MPLPPNATKIKSDARAMVAEAVASGLIDVEQPCVACGDPQRACADGRRWVIQHHDDYSKPLATRPLCRPCHAAWHARNTARLTPLAVHRGVRRADDAPTGRSWSLGVLAPEIDWNDAPWLRVLADDGRAREAS